MRLYQRLKRQILSRVYLVRAALGLALLAGLVAGWALVWRPLAPMVTGLWRATQFNLPNSRGRTNFLLLGREGAGSNRSGSDLTDTLILVSVHQNGDTVLLSVPRDLWIPSLRAKINTAFYYGEQRQPGTGGIILAKAAMEEVIGQPIHYAVVVDFAGFEEVINIIGGVDIEVERPFTDTKFPLPGRENDECDGDPTYACRYETIRFAVGRQHMDGRTALKYIRSRNASGEEGTDFARSRRQERLLLALRDELVSRAVLARPRLIKSIFTQVSRETKTDIPGRDYLALIRLGFRAMRRPVRTVALTEPDWVYHPPVSAAQDGQWVLLPVEGLPGNIENLLAVTGEK